MATKRHEDFVCVGFGHAKFRLVGMGAGFKPLDTSEALEAFQRAKRRVLLLDWGGTLQAITLPPTHFDRRRRRRLRRHHPCRSSSTPLLALSSCGRRPTPRASTTSATPPASRCL